MDVSGSSYQSEQRFPNLDAFSVHLIILFGFRPVQAGVTFLADEEVGEVHFLELQFDWLNEFGRNEFGRLGPFDVRPFTHIRDFTIPSRIAVGKSGQPNRTMTESVSP